jgi:predicted transcriptional regulator
VGTRKGNIAHHLKVLREAGLVRQVGSQRVRGGTEKYYERAARKLSFVGEHLPAHLPIAFRALADEIAAAAPNPFLVLRYLRLSAAQVEQITAALTDIAHGTVEAGEDQPRYGLLLGLYRPER